MAVHRQSAPYGPSKVRKVLDEFAAGTLHSGSSSGPRVTSRKQAIAIALAEQRRKSKRGGKEK
jgi:hypothetical protein